MADEERVRFVQDAFWRNEKLCRRIEQAEDMARRDPASAARRAKRFADLQAKLAADHAAAAQPSSVAGVVCGTDLKVALPTICSSAYPGSDTATAMAKSNPASAADDNSPISALVAVLPAGVVHCGDLVPTSPTTCSSLCPGGDMSSTAASEEAYGTLAEAASTACRVLVTLTRTDDLDEGASAFNTSAMEPGWATVTQACLCVVCDHLDHARQPCSVAMLTHAPVAVVDCAPPIVTPSEGITRIAKAPTSAMPLTRAALGVHVGSITNEHHRPHSVSINSVSLFQWDPGEKTRLSRESVLSSDSAWCASVKQLDADLSGSHDHDQKSGYANVQTYLHWFIQLPCSSKKVIGKYFCQDIYMELLQYLFDSVGPFYKQDMGSLVVCPPAYLAICAVQVPFADFLLESFGVFQKNCQPPYLKATQSCMFEGTTHHGTEYFPWKIAWLLLEPSGAHSELGVSGNLTNMCHLFGSWGKLISMLPFISSFYGTVFKHNPTDAYSTEHERQILGRMRCLLIKSVKKYTAAICVPAMNSRHADATVQEKKAYYVEYNSTLVAMLDIYRMQWKISLLLSHALISEFGTYFALEMVSKNDKLLASVKSWFPSCLAGCDFRYGRENSQWTIAWPPSSRGYAVYPPAHAVIGSLCGEIQSKENLVARAYGHLIVEAHLAALRFPWWPPQVITLHKSEQITWIVAWLPCDFLSCSSMIAASKYTYFGGSGHVPRKWGLISWKNAMTIVHQMMLTRYNPFPGRNPVEMVLLHNILLQDWPLIPYFIEYIIGCVFDLLQWKIAWMLDLESSVVSSGLGGSYLMELFDLRRHAALSSQNFGFSSSDAHVTLTLKRPMEQWDPGIARTFDICTRYSHVSCHLISAAVTTEIAHEKLLQVAFELYTMNSALLHDRAHIQAEGSGMNRIRPPLQDYLLKSCDVGHICFGGSASFSGEAITIGNLVKYRLYVQSVRLGSIFSAQPRPYVLMLQPRLPWARPVNVFSSISSMFCYHAVHSVVPIWIGTSMRTDGSQCKCGWRAQCILVESLVVVMSNQNDLVVSVAVLGADMQLLWDPGGQNFFGFFTRADYFEKVCADQVYYLDILYDQIHNGNDYYLGVFLEQVCAIYYLNIAKICVDYGTHRDLVEVIKLHVPWDPGGSTRHRLEVKPKFKEGGMLATFLPADGPPLLGQGLLGSQTRRRQINTSRTASGGLGSEQDGFGLLCFCLFLPPVFLFFLSNG